jgi:hypothetical protein
MNKEIKTIGKEKHYLLGIRDNQRYYLKEASWDCGWYWGLGYVESYFGKGTSDKSWRSHQHFDGMFLKPGGYVEGFRNFFDETVDLTDKEIWTLLELMKSAYISKQYAETVGRGGANVTSNPCKDIIINMAECDRINKEVIPAIMKEVYKILSPENN